MQRREFMRKVGLMGVIAATTPIPAFAVGPPAAEPDSVCGDGVEDDSGSLEQDADAPWLVLKRMIEPLRWRL